MSMNTDPPSGPASSADRAEKTLEKGLEAAAAPFRVLYDAPVNILIVDDEPKNLLVLETLLDNPGYRLVRAQSADEALLALVNEEFALLILDIQMPVTNGIELAKLIKQRKKTALIPIIFLTAYYNDGVDVLEGYGSGAVDYLHKPVNAAILRSKVAVFAELHRKSRELAVANRALLAEVTQRRRAEEQLRELNDTLEQRVTQRTEALRESEHFLQRITDVTPGVIYVFDFEQQCNVFVNRSFASILGYSDEEIKAMGADVTRALIHPEDLPRFGVHQARICALGDQEFADFEYRMRDRSGQWLWFHSRDVVFARSPAGGARQLIGMAMDVTTRKRAESELTEAVAAAEKANSAKSDFLSGMSHELRTPLNAILGFAQLLESEAPVPTPGQQRNVDQILKAGWYLLTLINEILDLAGIESGKVSISHEPVLLEAIFLECQAMIEPQAKKRGIEITFPRFATPSVVNADYTRLKQVMFNLLTNAIKYSREGGAVVVQCETRSENITRISVSDTGAGHPRERLAQLFQPFNRLGRRRAG